MNKREGEIRRLKDDTINKDGDESEIVEQMIEEEDVNDKLKFLEIESWEENRFVFVKRETDEMDIDKNGEEENETTFIKRTKLQDEKVLKKQRKIENDVALIQKDNDLEKKRKRQLSIEKKKQEKVKKRTKKQNNK